MRRTQESSVRMSLVVVLSSLRVFCLLGVKTGQEGLEKLTNSKSPLCIALRSNWVMVCLKCQEYSTAEQQATLVLQADPHFSKAWYRRALAREGMAETDEAETHSIGILPHMNPPFQGIMIEFNIKS